MDEPSQNIDAPTQQAQDICRIRFLFASGADDLTRTFGRDATVADVKQTLLDDQSKGNQAPPGDLPRLVWGGRMLRDEEVLSDVLVGDETEHSIIVAGKPTDSQSQARKPVVSPRQSAHESLTTPSAPIGTSPSAQPTPTPTQTQASTASSPSTSTLLPGMTLSSLISQVQSSALNPQPKLTPNPGYVAAYEALFYYSFLASNAVYAFTGEPELSWWDLRPAPLFPVEKVREAAEAVLKVNGIRRDGTMGEEVGSVQTPDDEAKEEREGDELLSDSERKKDAEGDEYIEVEVNGLPYKLMIPDSTQISSEQKRALGRYLAIRRVIKTLQDLLVTTPLYAPVAPIRAVRITSPTPTAAAGNRYVTYRRGYFMFRIPVPDFFLLFAIWTSAFWALIKVGTVLYMFTRGIPHDDPKFICLTALAIGWWIWDCSTHVRRVRASRRRAREADRARARAARGVPPGRGRAREVRPVAPAVRVVRAPGGNLTTRLRTFWTNIGIAYDRRILRLFYFTPDANTAPLEVSDRRIPGSDTNLPHPPSPPSAFWRLVCLPVILFFVTMVPMLDTGRRSVILERERHMRLLVEKLTREKAAQEATAEKKRLEAEREKLEASRPEAAFVAGPSTVPLDFFSEAAYGASQGTGPSNQSSAPTAVVPGSATEDHEAPTHVISQIAESAASGQPEQPTSTVPRDEPASQENPPAPSPIMPRYLCPEAIAYYRRIIGSTERIDWEAERQAQAALLANNGGAEAAADVAGDDDVPVPPAL